MTLLIEPKFRMMSEIKRWGIVPNVRQQDIANHSYYVAVYARELCHAKGIRGYDYHHLLEWALFHDVPEIETGDICGPVKRQVVDREELRKFELNTKIRLGLDSVYDPTDEWEDGKNILKAANLIDEVWFRAWDAALGNRLASVTDSMERLRSFMYALQLHDLFDDIRGAVLEFMGHPVIDWPRDTTESNDAPKIEGDEEIPL